MGTKKKLNHYSDAFKWRVVQEVLSGRFSKEEARKVYGIKSNCAILYWMRQFSGIDDYRSGGEPTLERSNMEEMKEQDKNTQRIQELEEELKRERIRADLWQKMIELAENQLNVDIRKKFGAKPYTPSKSEKENR
jgi:transposase